MHASVPGMHHPHDQPHADPADGLFDPAAQEWEKNYAIFQHLSLLSVLIGVPIVPILIMWLVRRDRSPFIDDHGKEALNFQISLCIYTLASIPLSMICGIGVPLMIAAWVLGVVGMILATVAASKGRYYRYPMCLRLVK
jgi:uncharacterized protein